MISNTQLKKAQSGYLLPLEDRRKFAQEAIDLFTNKRQGHLIHRCYLTDDALYYGGKFSSAPKSYMKPGEICAIFNSIDGISALVENLHGAIGVERGPGMQSAIESKSIPFFGSIKGLHTYVARDTSQRAIDTAKAEITQKLYGVKFIPDLADFNKAALPDGLPLGRKVFAEFGMTTGNMEGFYGGGFPYHTMRENVEAQKRLMQPGDIYTFTFDCNQNGREVEAAYNSDWTELWAQELLFAMQHELEIDGDFDPQAFRFRSIWDESSHGSFNYVIATRDMSFAINGIDVPTVKAGDRFGITVSYKMPIEMTEQLQADTGLELEMFKSDNERIAMPAFRMPF